MISITDRIDDKDASLDADLENALSGLWTSMPAIVKSFNPTELTCEVQPAIKGKRTSSNGGVIIESLPLLIDCPVVFPHAGGCSITFPIKAGDEVLVVFASRCIDLWWKFGGQQLPAELRMHDLSDGFVLAGVYSQPNVIGSVSTSQVEIRSDDRQAYIAVHPTTHQITINTSGNVIETVCGNVTQTVGGNVSSTVSGNTTLICQSNTVKGNLTVTGLITGQGGLAISGGSGASVDGNLTTTGDVKAAGISLDNHTHSGVQSGDSSTGKPQ